ncbi:MAG: hypothetical protein IT356_11845 [Gemmatimonadaceae bacterium]|nr:hypothetical protein [Gemmatimonadaceae bacterium]
MGVAGAAALLGRAAVAVLSRPGKLARESIAGTRSRAAGALPLFVASVAAFALAGPVRDALVAAPAATPVLIEDIGMDSASFVADPVVQANLVVRALGAGRAWTVLSRPAVVADAVARAFPWALVLLVPFFAGLTWMMWRPLRAGYGAHCDFALDLHTAVFAALAASALADWAASTVLSAAVGVGGIVYTTWYGWAAFRRGLGGTPGEVAARTTVAMALYTPLAVAVTAIFAFATLR